MQNNMLLLVVTIALINSEQNLLAPNLSAVAISFNFTGAEKDLAAGGLALSLFLVGAPAALLLGAAADGWARRIDLMVLVLVLGAMGCAGSALSWTYQQLWCARAVTGVALGGALPLTFSLLGDLVGPARRTAHSGRIGVAMTVGTAAGQGLAGLIGPMFGWRQPFVIVSFLMLVQAAWVRAAMTEPPRPVPPAADIRKRTGINGGRRWVAIFRIRTVVLILLQGVPGCVPWGVISAFLPDFLHADRGFSVHEATIIMTGFSFGGGIGTIVGGELGQRLHNRSMRYPALLMLGAGLIGVIPLVLLIVHTPASIAGCCFLALVGGLFATMTGPNVRATLTNVTATDQRGLAFAAFALFDDIGKGAGPALLALGITRWGRQDTFAWAMLGWIPCAALNGATAFTIGADGWHTLTRKHDRELQPLMADEHYPSGCDTPLFGASSAPLFVNAGP